MAGWIAGIALALVIGVWIGHGAASQSTRATIAQECRSAGAFTVKRTAFDCEVKR